MEVCSNFGSMPDMRKESDAMLMMATAQELKMLIPNPAKGAMAIDIIRWAMNQAVSDDAKQRKRAIVPPAVIGGEPKEEEEPAQMPVRAPEAGHRNWQIDLDSAEDDDAPPPRTVMDKKMKASHSTRRSVRLNGAVSQCLHELVRTRMN
ncbi:Chitinase domain-containing protein 1 [Hordeum vulgare]|nr:Chitinase domain-containing protein 1 [Hordeum vulgare]